MNKIAGLKNLIIAMLLAFCSAALAGTQIDLPPEASVNDGYIRISEIATLSGDQARRISRIYIGPAPSKGQQLQVTREHILRRLRGLGIGENIEFTGSEAVAVTLREGQANTDLQQVSVLPKKAQNKPAAYQAKTSPAFMPVKPDTQALPVARAAATPAAITEEKPAGMSEEAQKRQINTIVTEFVRKQLDNEKADVVCEIRKLDIPEKDVEHIELDGIRRGELPGLAEISLTLRDNSGKISGYGIAEIRSQANIEVPVTARPLRKGEELRGSDIVLRKMCYSSKLPTTCTDPNKFIGMIPVKMLRAGVPVSIADFEPALDIKRGQAVTLTVQGPGFVVREMCTALSDGRKGEMIKVESLIGKTTYPARVVAPGKADLPVNSGEMSANK